MSEGNAMVHVIQRWAIRVYGLDGKMRTEMFMDEDSYGRVMETVSRLNFGIDVNRVTVERHVEPKGPNYCGTALGGDWK